MRLDHRDCQPCPINGEYRVFSDGGKGPNKKRVRPIGKVF